MKPGIVDYGGGNLQSVRNALRHLGADPTLVDSPESLERCDALLFPGQGAFGDTMTALRTRGLLDPLRRWIADDRPFFGICIGYQALFEGSDENPGVEGLGVFAGQVIRFLDRPGLKVPHMGWNAVRLTDPEDPVWRGLPADPYFYYVHSYFPAPEDPSLTAGVTDYAGDFVGAIRRGRLIATQFHPEKSQGNGLRLLANFLEDAG